MESSKATMVPEKRSEDLRFTFIVTKISKRKKLAWKETFTSITSQELPQEYFEIVTCCPPGLLNELTSLPVTNLAPRCMRSSSVSLSSAVSATTNPFCIFIEEPLILPPQFLTAVSHIFRTQPLISAIQTSIDVLCPSGRYIPDRAGFKTVFKLPVLDGRLCAIRREHLTAAGGIDSTCLALHWADLSWRLMLSSTILHSTTEIPAVMLTRESAASRFRSAFYQGISLAFFIARWRVFLQKRSRKITIQLRERLRRQRRAFLEQCNRESYRPLLSGFLDVLIWAAFTCITLVPAILVTRPVTLSGRKRTGLYPDTFFHSNSSGIYTSRVSLSNYSLLTADQAAYVTTLLSGNANNGANRALKDSSTEARLAIERQLRKLELLPPEVRT